MILVRKDVWQHSWVVCNYCPVHLLKGKQIFPRATAKKEYLITCSAAYRQLTNTWGEPNSRTVSAQLGCGPCARTHSLKAYVCHYPVPLSCFKIKEDKEILPVVVKKRSLKMPYRKIRDLENQSHECSMRKLNYGVRWEVSCLSTKQNEIIVLTVMSLAMTKSQILLSNSSEAL